MGAVCSQTIFCLLRKPKKLFKKRSVCWHKQHLGCQSSRGTYTVNGWTAAVVFSQKYLQKLSQNWNGRLRIQKLCGEITSHILCLTVSMVHGISTLIHQAEFVSYNFNCHSIVFSLVCPHSDPKSSKAIKTNGEARATCLDFHAVMVMQLKIKKKCMSYGKNCTWRRGILK